MRSKKSRKGITEREANELFREIEKIKEEEALREQPYRSVGTPEECCNTCCRGIGPDCMEGLGNYVLCTARNEPRTLDSVCMDWEPEEETK